MLLSIIIGKFLNGLKVESLTIGFENDSVLYMRQHQSRIPDCARSVNEMLLASIGILDSACVVDFA